MSVTDPLVGPVVEGLVECLRAEMARVPSPPRVVCVRPGDRVDLLVSQAYDECCAGLAWVRVSTFYPTRQFPVAEAGWGVYPPPYWAVVVELGAARCAPVADAARVPSCVEWTDVTFAVLDDAAGLRRAVKCWAAGNPDVQYVVGGWTPMTTEGGCTGGVLSVTVRAAACDLLEGEEAP